MRGVRHALGVRPVYKTVDTCAAEFAALTPYHYSTYDEETEVAPRERPAVIILGSGPNRIGQGVEFDYSCVHASFALRDAGYDTVMVNCNPETVSTDYDTSSRLYFEPLTLEDVLEVVHAESLAGPIAGVIVQLGGQTPLGLAKALKAEGVPIVGTSPEAIDLAEDRGAFGRVLHEANLPAPKHGTAYSARRGGRDRQGDRLPGARAAVVRARRARHGDRLRRRDPVGLRRAGDHREPRPPGARRPLPRRRHRDRRRRALRRHRDVPRRDHGAHRGGRHPLRRLLVHPAAGHPRGRPSSTGCASPRSSWPRASGCAA